eukprot:TRINITY_DN3919_c0_g1_i1.p1 TRINITY_DN3919_c0_g1~~TRINITY_DN3919_c0_g1_i1.p1  ORF type:complete len:485 (-),score=57.82 TRINITY_DN3919_c0_g1_i1:272-1726(-)
MMIRLLTCFSVFLVVASESWDRYNDPALFSSKYSYKFSSWPTKAATPTVPWSDTYWPSSEGGIAARWQGANASGFGYRLHTKQELLSGSVDINILSPAEKFDLYQGRYDYPLVNSEWNRVSPEDPYWEGLCHGWVPAAEGYDQPDACTVSNDDGLKIPFASSDVKALLSYFLAMYSAGTETLFAGNRCDKDLEKNPRAADTPQCRDINAGAFAVIMAGEVAAGRSFAFDIDRSLEVWNQPLFAYAWKEVGQRPPSAGAASGTVSEVRVAMRVQYVKEVVPQPRAYPALVRMQAYEAWLEIGPQGQVLGGSWAQFERPDFVWREGITPFFGYFTRLQTLYAAATVNGTAPRALVSSGLPGALARAPLPTPADGNVTVPAAKVTHAPVVFRVPANATVRIAVHDPADPSSTTAHGGTHAFRVRVYPENAVGAPDVVHFALVPRHGGRLPRRPVWSGSQGAFVVVDAPRWAGMAAGTVHVMWERESK